MAIYFFLAIDYLKVQFLRLRFGALGMNFEGLGLGFSKVKYWGLTFEVLRFNF